MEKELLNAAQEGSVDTLLKLLHQDEYILRRYISGCFKETPLHIAAMLGHLEFTKAVLSHMPEMTEELDRRKSTPLHVATANGHILVVKALLSVNAELCFAEDCEARNPVHIAVIKGHTEILKELVQFRPHAAKALLGASTILHLCVKHYQLEALKYLLEVFLDDAGFVNFKDEEGFTILHLAVAEKQTEVVKLLLQHHQVEVNGRNAYGLTALDISLARGRKNIKDKEVAECFQKARELVATSTTASNFGSEDIICNEPAATVVAESNSKKTRLMTGPFGASLARQIDSYDRECNTLMLVASIIATVTFQAMMDPPKYLNGSFKTFNTLSFSATIGIILLLISGFPVKNKSFIWLLRIIMWTAVMSTAATYYVVMETVKDDGTGTPPAGMQPPPIWFPPPRDPVQPPPIWFPPPRAPVQPPPAAMQPPPIWAQPPPAADAPAVIRKIWGMSVLVWLSIIILTLAFAIRIVFEMVKCFLRWMKKRRGQGNSNAQNQSCI